MIGRIEAIHERGEGSFVTDTTTLEATSGTSPRRSGALTAMRLAELQGLASSMGISGTAKMRKGDLVAAIKARQNGESGPASTGARREPDHDRAPGPGAPQATEAAASSRAPRGPRTDAPSSRPARSAPRTATTHQARGERQERTEDRTRAPGRQERQDRTERQ